MTNLAKDEEEESTPIIIKPKSAFRNAIERAALSPAVWLIAILALVAVGVVFGK